MFNYRLTVCSHESEHDDCLQTVSSLTDSHYSLSEWRQSLPFELIPHLHQFDKSFEFSFAARFIQVKTAFFKGIVTAGGVGREGGRRGGGEIRGRFTKGTRTPLAQWPPAGPGPPVSDMLLPIPAGPGLPAKQTLTVTYFHYHVSHNASKSARYRNSSSFQLPASVYHMLVAAGIWLLWFFKVSWNFFQQFSFSKWRTLTTLNSGVLLWETATTNKVTLQVSLLSKWLGEMTSCTLT